MAARTQRDTRRCWRYLRDGCRADAVNAVRIGDHAYHFCANPAHDPRGLKK
jgi:hypothetical protein